MVKKQVHVHHCFIFYPLLNRELKFGIPVTDENGNRLGDSSKAAQQAITQVVISRILMAAPGMGMDKSCAVLIISSCCEKEIQFYPSDFPQGPNYLTVPQAVFAFLLRTSSGKCGNILGVLH